MANFYKKLFRRTTLSPKRARMIMLKREYLHQKYLAKQATDPLSIAKGTIVGLPVAAKKVFKFLIFGKKK